MRVCLRKKSNIGASINKTARRPARNALQQTRSGPRNFEAQIFEAQIFEAQMQQRRTEVRLWAGALAILAEGSVCGRWCRVGVAHAIRVVGAEGFEPPTYAL